ncbi:hypothetical protein FEF31_03935, partial [Mesomycoplasma hyopneumoniae]|nr:hypothetical protein [Mesomycoplasma hyopneumoniae]
MRNIVDHEVRLSSNCDYDYYYENFLLYYLSNGFYPNPIERIISLNYKQEDYIYNLKLEDITKSAFFSKRLNNFHFYNDIRCLIGGWANNEYCDKNGKENFDFIDELRPSYDLYDGKGFEE